MENASGTKDFSVRTVRLSVRKKLLALPCLPVLAAVLSAILPVLLFPSEPLLLSTVPSLLMISAGWFLLGAKQVFFQLALPAFAGMCSLLCHQQIRENDLLREAMYSRMTASVEAEIQIDDPSLCGNDVDLPRPRRVHCRVTALRFSPHDQWQKMNSTVIAVFPEDHSGFFYGDRFRVHGILQRPDPPLLPGGFDYGAYLERRGIRFLLRAENLISLPPSASLYRVLLKGRDRLLSSLTKNMNPGNRSLAAALLFGCRQGIEPSGRDAFIRSGTIHILTVSGLHVGMFAGAVCLLLMWVPFRLRMLLMPLITLIYVYATGMQTPALRALLMLSCWCIPRAFLLRGGGLNSVFLACSLLLIWNPYQILDMGFQYSFLCVFFLIVSAPKTAEWLQLAFEKRRWTPHKRQSRLEQMRINLWIKAGSVLAGCLTAWLCAFILTVFYQGISVPFAMPANLIVIPAAYLEFVLFTLTALPSLLYPPLGNWAGYCLAVPLSVIDPVCHFFAGLENGMVPVPPLWTVFLGLPALWVFLCFSGRKLGLAGLVCLLGLGFFWCSGVFGKAEPEAVFVYGGRQTIPAFALSVPKQNFAMIVNPADFRTASALTDYLKRRGHPSVNVLLCSGAEKKYSGGAQYVFSFLPVENYLTPPLSARNKAAREARSLAFRQGTRIGYLPRNGGKWESGRQKTETIVEKDEFSFDISQNAFRVYIRMTPQESGGLTVRIETNGCERVMELPRRREMQAVREKLKGRKT